MQTIKTMFRSPRFVVGFIMVLTIVCYALFIPMIFTADPKESRAESPYYTEFADLHAALLGCPAAEYGCRPSYRAGTAG